MQIVCRHGASHWQLAASHTATSNARLPDALAVLAQTMADRQATRWLRRPITPGCCRNDVFALSTLNMYMLKGLRGSLLTRCCRRPGKTAARGQRMPAHALHAVCDGHEYDPSCKPSGDIWMTVDCCRLQLDEPRIEFSVPGGVLNCSEACSLHTLLQERSWRVLSAS